MADKPLGMTNYATLKFLCLNLKNELGLDQAIKTMEHECLLNIVYRGMMINKSAYRYFSRYGITETQFNVLMLLKYALSEGLSQIALSKRLVVNKADMTGLIDRLEKKKLVERLRDGSDRRINLIKATRKGKIKAWSEPEQRQSKRIKDLADIARLVEAHPHVWDLLTDELKQQVRPPDKI